MRLIVISAVALATAMLAVESFALRPMLDARVLRIMAGRACHRVRGTVYIRLESLKALLLLVATSFTMQWKRNIQT